MNGFVAPSGPSGECREVLCSVFGVAGDCYPVIP